MGTGNIVIARKYNVLEKLRLLRENSIVHNNQNSHVIIFLANRTETQLNGLVSSFQLQNSFEN